MTVENISLDSLEELLSQDGTVIVKLGSTTCAPCKAVAPVFDAISNDYPDAGKFVAITSSNQDEAKALTDRFGIRAVPVFLVFQNGKETTRVAQALPKTALARALNLT